MNYKQKKTKFQPHVNMNLYTELSDLEAEMINGGMIKSLFALPLLIDPFQPLSDKSISTLDEYAEDAMSVLDKSANDSSNESEPDHEAILNIDFSPQF